MPPDDPKPSGQKPKLIFHATVVMLAMGTSIILIVGKWQRGTLGWREWKFIAGVGTVVVLGGGFLLLQWLNRGKAQKRQDEYQKWK